MYLASRDFLVFSGFFDYCSQLLVESMEILAIPEDIERPSFESRNRFSPSRDFQKKQQILYNIISYILYYEFESGSI
jgi:hypothetical protein